MKHQNRLLGVRFVGAYVLSLALANSIQAQAPVAPPAPYPVPALPAEGPAPYAPAPYAPVLPGGGTVAPASPALGPFQQRRLMRFERRQQRRHQIMGQVKALIHLGGS